MMYEPLFSLFDVLLLSGCAMGGAVWIMYGAAKGGDHG